MNSAGQPLQWDEEELVRSASQGDLEAFNQLILHYQNMAYSHAYALLGDPDLADDAAQEGFIKAFQAMRGLRGGSFRGWLLKIITNTAYDYMRRARRHPTEDLFPEDEYGQEVESPAWLADPSPSVEATIEHRELSDRIYEALDELPDIYRTVITLIDINQLDYAEAAQALGVPIGTVRSRLARARLQMSARLRGDRALPRGSNQPVQDSDRLIRAAPVRAAA
jgi:RNA polymerase sigma-70 factor (ECF subfamily)